MSLFRQSTDQAREAFTAMPMQSRIISVMLAAVIAIGLAFLVRGDSSSGKEYLFGGRSLSEQELIAVELAFGNAGLNDWMPEGHRVKIPVESRGEYLAALENSSALPMSLRTSVQEAIDKTSVFEPSELSVARQDHAKELDLGTKIGFFPDVRWATVEYDRGERFGLDRSRPQSASVVVNPIGTSPLNKDRIRQIQEMIRSSYAGMSSEDVVVIDTNSTTSPGADEDDPLLRKQREAEARIEQKIRALLVGYPVRVAASAEIDPTMDVETTTVKYDAEPTNLTSKSRKVESSSNRPLNRGVPGAASNGLAANRPVSLEDDLEVTKTKEDERESTGVAGQQYEQARMASLQVKRVRVSVGLPDSYYPSVYLQEFLQKNPGKSESDLPPLDDATLEQLRADTKENIQSAVTVLLPEVSAGEDKFPLVNVFHYPDLPSPTVQPPETAKVALTWLADSWQTIALIMLALVALLVARSAARGGTGDTPPAEFAEGFGLDLPAPPVEPDRDEDDQDQMTITGGSLKEELTVLVEKNPEVAANVIRGWVGEAA